MRREKRAELQEQKRREKAAKEENQKEKEARSYSTLMQVRTRPSNLTSTLSCIKRLGLRPAAWMTVPCQQAQANSMTSSAEMAKKYSSAQEYEDDFM